jgi:hypothetical protein
LPQPLVGDALEVASVELASVEIAPVEVALALVIVTSGSRVSLVVTVGSGSALVLISVVVVVVVVSSGSRLEVETVVSGSGSAEQVLVDSALRHSTADMAALLILKVASLGSLRLVRGFPISLLKTQRHGYPVHTR